MPQLRANGGIGRTRRTSSILRSAFLALAVFLGPAARAQVAISPDTNLFGDEIVRYAASRNSAVPDPPRAGREWSHLLIFQDHRQLRGAIVSMDQDEIVFSRPGASDPLRIARRAVRRILFDDETAFQWAPEPFVLRRFAPDHQPAPAFATIQLAGADWLNGEVASADGRTFTLKLDARTTLTIPRSAIDFLYFATTPAPASGFAGNLADLEGWTGPAVLGGMRLDGGAVSVDSGEWLGRSCGEPPKFEVDFTVLEGAGAESRLWFQPRRMEPNLYTQGTVEMGFSSESLRLCQITDPTDQKHTTIPYPDEAKGGSGPVSYRVLYDRPGNRLIILRNGHRAADFPLDPKAKEQAAPNADAKPDFTTQFVCLDGAPRFQSLRIAPWDGVVPKDGGLPLLGDRLSTGSTLPQAGKLEAVGASGVTFSGAQKAFETGLFLQFGHSPAPANDADCRLLLGGRGELNVADLRIEGGRVRFRGVSGDALDWPIDYLSAICLPATPPPAAAPADLLVFSNGDELPGALVTAAAGESLRWRTLADQEVDIDPAAVAGVRFESNASPSPKRTAVADLRNGDRLRGDFVALDAATLKIVQPQLGGVSLERAKLWKFYPNPSFPVFDGSFFSYWLPAGPRNESPWIHLDGAFFTRNFSVPGSQNVWWVPNREGMLVAPLAGALDRYEMNCDITGAEGRAPSFHFTACNPAEDSALMFMCRGQLTGAMLKGRNNNVNRHDFEVGDALHDRSARVNLRAFVDAKAGTVDIYLDGLPVGQVGRSVGEQCPGIFGFFEIGPEGRQSSPVIFSNLRIAPWSGESPAPGGEPRILFANGDMTHGAIGEVRDGKLGGEERNRRCRNADG